MTPKWKPEQVRVDQLTVGDLGGWIQIPGNRGVLRGAWTDDDGLITVVTTVGIAHYKPETLAWVEA